MAKAICWKCGDHKRGALIPCPNCHVIPKSEEEQILSVMLTEHYLDNETINSYQSRIRNGAVVVIDEESQRTLRPVIHELGILLSFQRKLNSNNTLFSLIFKLFSKISASISKLGAYVKRKF